MKARLKELCPKGIDIFFDNVGGDILDAALGAACDAGAGRPLRRDLGLRHAPSRRRDRGTTSTWSRSADGWRASSSATTCRARAEAIVALSGWIKEGKLKHRVDVQQGLENAPATLRRLFEGKNEGKQLLRIAE